ncbi:hypothetical protein L9F63_012022 [Diploptera punctata]|uniref:Uncharacterized protein n=1 Tax=Diploptera punctata TaxID=6984 RepID=A0AAD8EPB8_DIPPU|nr:hypothetical protein L9F63_012022 [Diploptera punctata]
MWKITQKSILINKILAYSAKKINENPPLLYSMLLKAKYKIVVDGSLRLLVLDIPTQVPPLTPGTNKKMTEALKASFASWEKEQLRLNIVKGKTNHIMSHTHAVGTKQLVENTLPMYL